jgi:hypothetical protein
LSKIHHITLIILSISKIFLIRNFAKKMMNIETRSRTRRLVKCDCPNCKGKYVDPRTRNKHSRRKIEPVLFEDDLTVESSAAIEDSPIIEASHSFINEEERTSFLENVRSKFPKLRKRVRKNNTRREYEMQISKDNEDNDNLDDDEDDDDEDDDDDDNEEDDDDDNDDNEEDDDDDNDNEDDDDDSDNEDDEGSNNFENYSPPPYEFSDDTFEENWQHIDEEWIVVFILRFQTRFRLADTAVDTLIKFLYHVLTKLNRKFSNISIYRKKEIKIGSTITFILCMPFMS